jgi:hypothetical protein
MVVTLRHRVALPCSSGTFLYRRTGAESRDALPEMIDLPMQQSRSHAGLMN